ncbi:MAG TPA: hypothetical protein VMG12_10280 [Polyangiaceae bacterium]|nr:hypothetical protein [Polyangiaceae bacterium]
MAGWLAVTLGACARFDFDPLQGSSGASAASAGSAGDGNAAAPGVGGAGSGGQAGSAAGGDGASGDAGAGGLGGSGGADGAAGTDGVGGSTDAGPSGIGGSSGAGGSSGDELPPCSVLGSFGAPEPLTGLGAGSFFSPAVFDDAHVLIFASSSPGDLFSARRATRGSPAFGDVSPLSVNTSSAEVTPWLSADGLELLFASDRSGAQSPRDLMRTTRPSLDAPFATPTFITEVNSFWTENLPSLHANGRLLVFSSDRPGGAGIMDLWQASRPGATGPFGNAGSIAALNGSSDDSGATLTGDARRVYFTSERPGGAGGRDLWFAERTDAGATFSAPRNLSEINGTADEADPAISADDRELFFATSRAGGSQLWHALRTCISP